MGLLADLFKRRPQRNQSANTVVGTEGRGENPYLQYIVANYSSHPRLPQLLKTIPLLANRLRDNAVAAADALLKDGCSTANRALLANCVFDLQLVACFDELFAYTNADLASLSVDALLYEATGYDKSTPSEMDIIGGGTQNFRGITKYVAGKKVLKIGDSVGWQFGMEYSAITGHPRDIAYITSVRTFTLLVRKKAVWLVKEQLHGTLPSSEEVQAFEASL